MIHAIFDTRTARPAQAAVRKILSASLTAGFIALSLLSTPLLAENLVASLAHPTQLALPTCGSSSPRLEQLGADTYFNMKRDLDALSPRDYAELERTIGKYFKQLEGRWRGELVDHVCQMTLGINKHIPNNYRLSWVENTTTHKGALDMRMERIKLEKYGRRTKQVSLKQTRQQYQSLSGLISAEQIDNNTLLLTSQYRQANSNTLFATPSMPTLSGAATPTPRLSSIVGAFGRERKDVIHLQGKHLTVISHWYSQGIYTGTEIYTLKNVH